MEYYGYYYASLKQKKASDMPFTRKGLNCRETWRLREETINIIKNITTEPGPYKVFFNKSYEIIKVIPEKKCDSLL